MRISRQIHKLTKKAVALFVSVIIISQPVFAAEEYKSRDEVPEQYKWKLSDIYKTEADWNKDIKLLENELIPQLASYKGTLDNKENVLSCLNTTTKAEEILYKVFSYAQLTQSLDAGNSEAQMLYGRAITVYQKMLEAVSYIEPELLKSDVSVIEGYIDAPDFKNYARFFDALLKKKPHILSEGETELLSQLATFSEAPGNIFSMINNVDIEFPSVKDSKGNVIEVTSGNYSRLMESNDRELRKAVYESYRGSYMELNNTLAATLAAEVNKNVFYAKAQNYSSALEASLGTEIPVSIYTNLINSVNKGLTPLHKYISLRKEALGTPKVQAYDLYVPLTPGLSIEFSYDNGKKTVLEALKPMGGEYAKVLNTAFNENWIDVYETPSKESGAFSASVYGTHPYILLNYSGTFYDVSTTAHELGHAVHQYYSSVTQPFTYADVPIFTTEVASTTNEILLGKYMIENAGTNAEKLFYVNNLLNTYYGTFYAQTLYAEFEKTIHETVEGGGTLTADSLNDLWGGLISKYYGESFELNEYSPNGWSGIPHFYYNFYVYKYATSIAAANKVASEIINKTPGALDKYIEFLHSGSRYDPIETLASVGIDMTTPQIMEEFVKEFDALVDEMERLMRLEGIIE